MDFFLSTLLRRLDKKKKLQNQMTLGVFPESEKEKKKSKKKKKRKVLRGGGKEEKEDDEDEKKRENLKNQNELQGTFSAR
jgi:hypothetical protein